MHTHPQRPRGRTAEQRRTTHTHINYTPPTSRGTTQKTHSRLCRSGLRPALTYLPLPPPSSVHQPYPSIPIHPVHHPLISYPLSHTPYPIPPILHLPPGAWRLALGSSAPWRLADAAHKLVWRRLGCMACPFLRWAYAGGWGWMAPSGETEER